MACRIPNSGKAIQVDNSAISVIFLAHQRAKVWLAEYLIVAKLYRWTIVL